MIIKAKYLIMLLLALSVSACSLPFLGKAPAKQPSEQVRVNSQGWAGNIAPRQFSSLDELRGFLGKSEATPTPGRGGMLQADTAVSMAKTAVPATTESADGRTKPNDYSPTNNQVKGVDEADIVKTDGEYLYIVSNQKLRIVRAYPGNEAALVKELDLPGYASQLLVSNGKLAVFGQDNQFNPEIATTTASSSPDVMPAASSPLGSVGKMAAPSLMPRYFGEFSFLRVYDLADKVNPRLERDLHLDGSYLDARQVGDFVYLVSNKYGYESLDAPLPRIWSGASQIGRQMPPVYYFDQPYQSYAFTTVTSISMSDASVEPDRQVYLMSGQENLYVSDRHIYLAYTKSIDEQKLLTDKYLEVLSPRLSAAESDRVRRIQSVADDILNKWERQYKLQTVLDSYLAKLAESERQVIDKEVKSSIIVEHPKLADELQSTVVHRIGINQGKMEYEGEIMVPGQLLNQFSMDESGDSFRLATSRTNNWSQILPEGSLKESSNLFVFDKDLKLSGELRELAPGEQIYSARFMGDRAYLVTFVKTDPLFVIDLASSTPKVLGELKLPDYSNYLHPVGDNLILGIGRTVETSESGVVISSGLKAALFDVNDPANPAVLSEYKIGGRGSDSAALYDHKAFLYDQVSQTVVIPATLTEGVTAASGWGKLVFNGCLVLDLTGGKIALRGRIAHETSGMLGYFDYLSAVRRAVRIESELFTISDGFLQVNDLKTLDKIKTVNFWQDTEKPIVGPTEPALLR